MLLKKIVFVCWGRWGTKLENRIPKTVALKRLLEVMRSSPSDSFWQTKLYEIRIFLKITKTKHTYHFSSVWAVSVWMKSSSLDSHFGQIMSAVWITGASGLQVCCLLVKYLSQAWPWHFKEQMSDKCWGHELDPLRGRSTERTMFRSQRQDNNTYILGLNHILAPNPSDIFSKAVNVL